MNKTLAALIASSAACLCMGVVHAQDAASAADGTATKSVKKHADAKYTADKKNAEGNEALNKANCGSSLTAAGRACKDDAAAAAKKQKADAKVNEVNTKAGNN